MNDVLMFVVVNDDLVDGHMLVNEAEFRNHQEKLVEVIEQIDGLYAEMSNIKHRNGAFFELCVFCSVNIMQLFIS